MKTANYSIVGIICFILAIFEIVACFLPGLWMLVSFFQVFAHYDYFSLDFLLPVLLILFLFFPAPFAAFLSYKLLFKPDKNRHAYFWIAIVNFVVHILLLVFLYGALQNIRLY
jgi:hypothetical protein